MDLKVLLVSSNLYIIIIHKTYGNIVLLIAKVDILSRYTIPSVSI